MLPLLPALILLLLQGPAGIERMASNGQLPSALNALHRHIANSHEKTTAADEVVFASLLAAGQDRGMSCALLKLLTSVDVVFVDTGELAPKSLDDPEDHGIPIRPAPRLGALSNGYFTCQRSRDGPFLIA
jgi:hypothetical protein